MTLRVVQVDRSAVMNVDPGPVPQVDWIEVERLRIDDRYQRPLTEAGWRRIRVIAAGFRWSRFAPIMVVPRPGGVFAVIDGQHRAHAAALAGIAMVPSVIGPASDLADEARAFGEVNRTLQPAPAAALYRAALAAGEHWAVDIDQWAAQHGVEVMSYQPSAVTRRPGTLICFGWLRVQLAADRGAAAGRVVRWIRDSDLADETWAWGQVVLQALVTAQAKHPKMARHWPAFISRPKFRALIDDVGRLRALPQYRRHSLMDLRLMAMDEAVAAYLAEARS